MKLRNIPFSPPDMTEAEAKEVHFGVCAHGQDGMSELGNGCTGDGAAPAGYSA